MTYNRKIDVNPGNSLGGIILLVLVFVGLYFIAKGIFTLLSWLAPLFIVATLFINYKVLVNYGVWVVNLFKKNPLMGVGMVLLTIFGFPIISGFLFAKALLYRKVDQMKQQHEENKQGELIDYEEIDDEPTQTLELPQMEPRQPRQQQRNDYEQLFDDD
ncbi:MAG: hypothetical protein AAGG75_26990 [Bacteroidota bacterium]